MEITEYPPPDTRGAINRANILYRKAYDARMYAEWPQCHNEDRPWRRYPGCSNGCRMERTVARREKRRQRRRLCQREVRDRARDGL
ncbi:hypothetical protein HDU86_003588 [Geranomyces michiganensis]|nr:hypothetical protein HDU86_003588 [Geranomyces michiganensis]